MKMIGRFTDLGRRKGAEIFASRVWALEEFAGLEAWGRGEMKRKPTSALPLGLSGS